MVDRVARSDVTTRFVAGIVLVLGLGLRLTYLDVPPMEFHPTRQYRAALIARASSATAMQSLAPEARAAAQQMGAQEALEPQVMEGLAVAAYAAIGHEDLRAPRLFSIAAWLLAAACAAWLVRLSGAPAWAALVPLAVTLLTPYGIDASRAFMPDPLMTGLTMLALALAVRHARCPSHTGQVALILTVAGACYVKPMAGLLCVPALLLAQLAVRGWRGLLVGGISATVAMAPTVVYYSALMTADSRIDDRRFFPQLWTQTAFWSGWLEMVDRVVGLQALVFALVALVVVRRPVRAVMGGAWLGYLFMGFVFPHHIHTHDYYSLPLIPLVAASLGAGLPWLLGAVAGRWRALAAATVVLLLLAWPLRTAEGRHPWGNVRRARLVAADYTRIGMLVDHSTRVATLEGAYGFPLAYHGQMGAVQLALSIDRAVARLQGQELPSAMEQMRGLGADFFVGTLYPEVAAQPDLARWLDERGRLIERAGPVRQWRYVVYDVAGR